MEYASDVHRDSHQPTGEELLALQNNAEQLRHTVLQQKKQIFTDQEAFREVTGKLSRCENGLDKGYQGGTDEWGLKEGAMGDLPLDPPQVVQELEEAVRRH